MEAGKKEQNHFLLHKIKIMELSKQKDATGLRCFLFCAKAGWRILLFPNLFFWLFDKHVPFLLRWWVIKKNN